MAIATGPIDDPTHAATIEIGAPPQKLWEMVAEVTRTPEWSPACYRTEWIGDPAEPFPGARFRGYNRLNGARWSRECVVTEADAGRVFAFSTIFKGAESTRWRYSFHETDTATTVTEAYQVVRAPLWLRLLWLVPGARAKSERDTRWNISTTLERLKTVAERSTPS